MTAHRREAIRLAKAQEKAVSDKCIRAGQDPPGYSFDELIGKGSFGRVYKGRQKSSGKVVALKVLDIDEADFQALGDMRDEQIRDFNKEIAILRRAQESGAQNLNQMIEAFAVHSQLWLICEHCPGGSVKTLMRATRDRLEEKYLIVVARELAKALEGLHQAGIMHRDVKAANVLIHENGGLQLCDFGIAAAIEGQTDKRRTFVGTFHWMPPELWADKPEYNDEVDVWGYGCTLYECATGTPPNSDVRERQQLKVRMRRLKQSIGLPEKDGMDFSDGLRSLVKFALNPDAASRPSMHDILGHDFLAATEEKYPTSCLTELVQQYYAWLFSGGHRVSLFMPGGAVAASELEDELGATMSEEWNFSMTQEMERRISTIFDLPDLSTFSHFEVGEEGDTTPRGPATSSGTMSPPGPKTATERANFELRVQRGEGLASLFSPEGPAYEYKQKRDFVPIREPANRTSDLPFRAMAEERPTSIASISIDLGDFDEEDYAIAAPRTGDDNIQTTYAVPTPLKNEPAFILPDAATIRAKRADSKGPRDGSDQDLTAKRSSSADRTADPTTEDWTAKRASTGSALQEAAEITPTADTNRPRDTMGWSFAAAMNEISEPPSPVGSSPPSSAQTQESGDTPKLSEKAQKHATMEWSFSMAMAEADTEADDETEPQRTPGRHARPTPLLRTHTMPVTSLEVQDAVEDWSRPSTSLSMAYSESSASSTDFDPFALDRRTPFEDDGPGDAEFDDSGVDEFYATRGRTMVPLDQSGPGPDIGMTITPHTNGHSGHSITTPSRPIENGHNKNYPNGTPRSILTPESTTHSPMSSLSPRRLGHIRGNGSGASRGSTSSIGSAIHVFTSNGSGSSGSGMNGYSTSRALNFPIPNPPSIAAMSGDASPTTMQRELERLLDDFQSGLGAAADILSETKRGRPTYRNKLAGSGSEWEDED